MTTPPSRPSARCRATSTSRTRGRRATAVAALSISGVRIARVTSWPSMTTRPSRMIEPRALREIGNRALVLERQALLASPSTPPRDTSRRCPRAIAQRRRHAARERALAGAGWSVDGDDQLPAAHKAPRPEGRRHKAEGRILRALTIVRESDPFILPFVFCLVPSARLLSKRPSVPSRCAPPAEVVVVLIVIAAAVAVVWRRRTSTRSRSSRAPRAWAASAAISRPRARRRSSPIRFGRFRRAHGPIDVRLYHPARARRGASSRWCRACTWTASASRGSWVSPRIWPPAATRCSPSRTPDLQQFRITPASTDIIEDAAKWLVKDVAVESTARSACSASAFPAACRSSPPDGPSCAITSRS